MGTSSASLILASTSRYRHELLGRLGLPFRACAPDCDEDSFKGRGHAPQQLAELLARKKAESVARLEPDSFVIGSDQVVDLDGEILGKPGSVAAAERQLARLQGREHRLITAVALCGPGPRVAFHTDITRLRMRDLGDESIRRYVAHDQPLDCAGSYKIESLGIALFEHIECADYNAIAGLPLLALAGLLRAAGFSVP
ncbi:MAG: Maf family protein [Myxococcales bacterium]